MRQVLPVNSGCCGERPVARLGSYPRGNPNVFPITHPTAAESRLQPLTGLRASGPVAEPNRRGR